MKNFRKYELDWVKHVFPLIQSELEHADPQLWELNVKRQQNLQAQEHTQNITLRGAKVNDGDDYKAAHYTEDDVTAAFAVHFPETMKFIERFSKEINAEFGRAIFARLKPRSKVHPHVDFGDYYDKRDRYHLVIESPAGTIFHCGDEEVVMKTGELWWFDNKIMHDTENPSDKWRSHLIFDVLPL